MLVPEADASAPPVFNNVQFQRDPDFCGRWLSQICLYLYRGQVQRPWRAVALFRTAAEDLADAADLDTWLGRVTAREAS